MALFSFPYYQEPRTNDMWAENCLNCLFSQAYISVWMKLSEKSLFAMEKVESLISIYETKRQFLHSLCPEINDWPMFVLQHGTILRHTCANPLSFHQCDTISEHKVMIVHHALQRMFFNTCSILGIYVCACPKPVLWYLSWSFFQWFEVRGGYSCKQKEGYNKVVRAKQLSKYFSLQG
jgi:hypothetical protein